MSSAAVRKDTVAARRAGGVNHRERIVAAAVRAIEEHGSDPGLAVIADLAGLPRPHVYRHFTGKDELDQAVARQAAKMLGAWIRPSLTVRGTPPEVIDGLVARVLQWAAVHPRLYRFRVRLSPGEAVPQLTRALAAYVQTGPPEHVVAGVIGLVDSSVLWWFDHRDEIDQETLSASLSAQVWLLLAAALTTLDPTAPLTPSYPEA
ncbi:TetR/AcrR family transcriptional regulator [Actinoplanes sp. CA-054009]